MAGKQKLLPGLSVSEWEVMKVLWQHGPLAARDVYSRLQADQNWTYATVKTFLRRAVKKGWLAYDQIGNSFLYRPAVPHEKAVFNAIREFSSRVLEGALTPFVAYFAKQDNLKEEDIAQLEEILKRHRAGGG